MKKTRILAFLVTICMATTAFLGGTIAKYSTTEDIEDTATVAKWGIQLKMSGSLFGKAYVANSNNDANLRDTATVYDSNNDTVTVNASANVVAPGTKGGTIDLSLFGKADVDASISVGSTVADENVKTNDVFLAKGTYAVMVKVENVDSYDFAALKADHALYTLSNSTYSPAASYVTGTTTYYYADSIATVTENDGYYPVVYTLTNNNDLNDTHEFTKVSALVSAIQTAFDNGQIIQASQDTDKDYDYSVSWAWDFDVTDDATDPADTILGYLAYNVNNTTDPVTVVKLSENNYVSVVSGTDYNLSTNFNISITVEQVD